MGQNMAKTKFSILNFLCQLKKRNGETLIPCKKCAHLKDMLHKELLQILVGVVDAQLLEPVHREILSAATQKKRSVKPIRLTR